MEKVLQQAKESGFQVNRSGLSSVFLVQISNRRWNLQKGALKDFKISFDDLEIPSNLNVKAEVRTLFQSFVDQTIAKAYKVF
jgi:hypothetical protein